MVAGNDMDGDAEILAEVAHRSELLRFAVLGEVADQEHELGLLGMALHLVRKPGKPVRTGLVLPVHVVHNEKLEVVALVLAFGAESCLATVPPPAERRRSYASGHGELAVVVGSWRRSSDSAEGFAAKSTRRTLSLSFFEQFRVQAGCQLALLHVANECFVCRVQRLMRRSTASGGAMHMRSIASAPGLALRAAAFRLRRSRVARRAASTRSVVLIRVDRNTSGANRMNH